MNKFLSIVIALALLFTPGLVFAAAADTEGSAGGSGMGTLRTYTTISVDSGTDGTYTKTHISTSTIAPGKCKLLGWRVTLIDDNQMEGLASIRDSISTTSDSDTYIIEEAEATTTLPGGVLFPAGMDIQRGITVNQGPNTCVTVYYVQTTP